MLIHVFHLAAMAWVIDPPLWLVAALVIIVLAAALRNTQKRRQEWEGRYGVKVCPGCGGSSPPHSRFCAACGGRVG